jgi:Flp pilus assembly protein TadD
MQAGDLDALLGEAMDCHQRGDLARADELYAQVLAARPDQAQALRLRGILARERGELSLSGALLSRAAAAAGHDPRPVDELALTRLAAGDLPGAETALRDALERDPGYQRARANLGALLQYRGRLTDAIDCHRQVLAAAPGDLEVRCNLANTLVDAGRGDEALAECAVGLEQAPDHPALLAARGAILVALERYPEALETLQRAVARNPVDDMALVNLGQALARLDRDADAVAALRQATAVSPENARATADLANLLAGTGEFDAALDLCRAFLARHPGERLVLAAQALALRDAGQAAAAAAIVDPERLIRLVDISAPPTGFNSLAAFNDALAASVLSDPGLLRDPASKSTRGGRQTGELDLDADPALAALAGLIHAEVGRFSAALARAGLGDHPAMAYATDSWTLRAWGTVLEAGGHQSPHLHPLGFLSGVYYVRLPRDMAAADSEPAGWLEFGQPPERLRWAVAPECRRVAPQAGRLVLFPSYFFHRTLPFQASQSRISIAFDVMPGR